jgi:hypothetical protein
MTHTKVLVDPQETASSLDVPLDVVKSALARIHDRSSSWIVVSGKICSGKDTIAPLVQPALGYTDVVRVGYSDMLKRDLGAAMATIAHSGLTGAPLVAEVAKVSLRNEDIANDLIKVVGPVLDEHGVLDLQLRTDLNRELLIQMGSTWLVDNAQLSRQAAARCLELISTGASVYLTGGRFEPDVAIPQDAGATIIRLDVSTEVQRQRLLARDGLEPLAHVINDAGEVALDNWPRFDVRVSNDTTLQAGLDSVLSKMGAHA